MKIKFILICVLLLFPLVAKSLEFTSAGPEITSHVGVGTGHSATFEDSDFDDNEKIRIDVSNSSSEAITDIAITTDYIIAVGNGSNTKYSQSFCFILLLDKNGDKISQASKDANMDYIDYTCSSIVVNGNTIYVVGQYQDTTSPVYYSAVLEYSIESGTLSLQNSKLGTVLTTQTTINSGIILGDYLYVAGGHNENFYLEQWDLATLTFNTSFTYDIYSGSNDDEVMTLLKNADESSLYLVGNAKSDETAALIRLAVSGSSVTQDTTYGNYSGLYLRDYTDGSYSHTSGDYLYLEDAYLDGDTVITTGYQKSSAGTYNIFMERIKSDGTGMESSSYVQVDSSTESGSAILASGDYVYVGGTLDEDSGEFNLAAWRFVNDALDTSFGTSGVVTTDFNSGYDFCHAMALDGDQLYLAGSVQGTDGYQKFGIFRYTLPSTTEEDDVDGETTCTASASTESSCYDEVDNECDGLVDCADDECAASVFCTGASLESDCANDLDDEADGYVDCDDSDCTFNSACVIATLESDCTNGVDDEADGLVDCNDSDCSTNSVCLEVNIDTSATAADIDTDVDTDTNAAEGGGGCGCNFTATSPHNLRAMSYLFFIVALGITLVVRKRTRKK